jgi:hypothetical protein
MLAMSGKTIFTVPFSVQSGRLITCMILLLLTFPLIAQSHEGHGEHTVCAVCTVSLGSVLPALEHFTVITLKPAGIVRNETTISARQVFSRLYDGRGPPQIS